MARVVGVPQLQARLHAIGGVSLMRAIALRAVYEEQHLVRRKTGNTGRSIHVASVSPTNAVLEAGGAAAFLEYGTRPHEITPKAARALRWAASPAGRRLTGSPRIGAAVVFATRVHHPGTKPYPFMVPGAQKAVQAAGADIIVKAWNSVA